MNQDKLEGESYRLIIGDPEELVEKVNRAMRNNWKPLGAADIAELTELTLGQMLSHINFSSLGRLLIVAIMLGFVGYTITGMNYPGYKNYYTLRLKRLLSQHVPNIANANGYSIEGYKITRSDSETVKVNSSLS